MVTNAPEVFYKDDLCQALCGRTVSELLSGISTGYVHPVQNRILRDQPLNEGEKLLERQDIFMATEFRLPIKPLSMDELYGFFCKFRDWERHVHPRGQFSLHRDYWEPTYDQIELAHEEGDETGLKEGIVALIDQILHD